MTTEVARAERLPERRRMSLESIQESRRGRAFLGLVVAAAIAAGVYAIILAFTGRFTNLVAVNAQLPVGSNAITVGAPVQYRNVTVGKVASETQGSNGSVGVRLDFYPNRIVNVPKGVESQVAPLSIFGNQYVDLVPPASVGQGHLESGDFIAAYTGQASTSLQGTVTQLYDLLNAIHPADLNTALSAFAEALNGEGTKLGQALDAASQYTSKTLQPNLDTIQSDLRLLVPVSNEVASATPDLLGLLANSETTGASITSQAANLHTLLATGADATGKLGDIFQNRQTELINIMNQSAPLLSDVTANPNELSLTLSGLGQWAAAWSSAESHGPFLSVTANLPVADISAGVNAALGYNNPSSIATALGSAFNPAPYTAANCPQYPGAVNPYCGQGGSPAASVPAGSTTVSAADVGLPSGSRTSQASSSSTEKGGSATSISATGAGSSTGVDSYPYALELQAIQSIATALDGGRPPASPGVASILLYPLFVSISGTP